MMTCRHEETGRPCPYADTCVSEYFCRYGWQTPTCPPKPPVPPHPPKPRPQPYDEKLDEIIGLLKQMSKGTDSIISMLADVSFDVKGILRQTSGKKLDESILDCEEMETLGKLAKKLCDSASIHMTADHLAKLVYIANLMKK